MRRLKLKRNHKLWLVILLFLGIVAQGLTMVRSGLVYNFGMGFWGANGHDGIWHLALTNQVLRSFPPPHPTLAGFQLTNYHYFYDLFLALVSQLTLIPSTTLYFQIFPIFLAAGLGILSFLVGYYWRRDFWTGFWLVFFNYFAGSFGYLVTLWRHQQLGGESLFWSMQSASTLVNPPFALSLVVILGGMLLLLRLKKWHFWQILGIGFLLGILVNIKAYAGVVGLTALGIFSLAKLIKGERIYLAIFGLALVVTGVIFLPLNQKAGSLFIFQPFWFIHSMIESADRLYLPRLALARYFLVEKGIGPRLIAIEAIGLLLFLFGNLGTRVIGGWDLAEKIISKKTDEFDYFLIGGMISGLVPPLLFVQKGTAWNTIQFFYYFLFFANFYAAATVARLISQRRVFLKWGLVFLIGLMTIPTSLATVKDSLGWPPPTAISNSEIEGLKFLKNKKEGIVLTYPYNEFEKNRYPTTPIPLRAYESTAYVSALTGKQTFLEDQMNLEISGYQWQARRNEVVKFFASQDSFFARGFLLNNKISYLFLSADQKFELTEEQLGIDKIFDNGGAKIYQVRGMI